MVLSHINQYTTNYIVFTNQQTNIKLTKLCFVNDAKVRRQIITNNKIRCHIAQVDILLENRNATFLILYQLLGIKFRLSARVKVLAGV